MQFASGFTQDLHHLATAYASHRGYSLDAVSAFVYGKGGFFDKLARGTDCRTGTLERGLHWFDRNWPDAEMGWPAGIARGLGQRKPKFLMPEVKPITVEGDELVFLQSLAHAPIWKNGKRPKWWPDIEIRAFIVRAHNQMSCLICAELGAKRFGSRFPKKTAIHEFWTRLDKITAERRAA